VPNIPVLALPARARARLGRTFQIDALAPYPQRPPQHLWAFTNRSFVRSAGLIVAGYDFNTESLRLRLLKSALAEDGVDAALIDSLDESDVTDDALGIVPSTRALPRLPTATAAKLTSPARPPGLRRGYSIKAYNRARAEQALARELTGAWVDSGAAQVEQLHLDLSGVGTRDLQRSINAPIRITHISASGQSSQDAAGASRYAWSVTPPGLGEGAGVLAALAALSPVMNGQSLSLACDVPVTSGAVELRASALNSSAIERIAILLAVSYRRLVRKT